MSTDVSAPQPFSGWSANPLAWRGRWMGLDKNPAIVAFAQTWPGILLMHAALLGCLAAMPILRLNHVALVAVSLALCMQFPTRRLAILGLTGTAYFLLRPFKTGPLYDQFEASLGVGHSAILSNLALVGFGLAFVAFAYAMIINMRTKRIAFVANQPFAFMVFIMTLLTALTLALPTDGWAFAAAWIALAYLASTCFFLGYILMDVRTKNPAPLGTQIGFLRPFWAGFAPPIKGPTYILKFEAKDDEALAVSRIKAVKLAVWALTLFLIWEYGFNRGLYGELAFPRLDALINATANGEASSIFLRWAAVGVDFMAVVVFMGAAVHATVATIRMAGFNIPRGMARPLASRSIAEFWGRYLFYFKEMLVDFFFYPAFRRFFKSRPKLRMAFATFCAAFIGNILFDLIHVLPLMASEGFWVIMERYVSYALYAGIMTIGIIWSQLATKPKPEDGWFRYDVLPRVQVIGFFALLQVIDDSFGDAPVADRLAYYGSLVGVM
ncbi:MAG: hypothetical protein AAFX98_01975 [Pseudomonadota bacterium]